jgi:hypothetical protein
MPYRPINEFLVQSEIALPGQDCTAEHRARQVCLSVLRHPLSDVQCLMRQVSPRIAYDVGTGILFEPRGVLMYVNNEADTIMVESDADHLSMAGLWVVHLGFAVCTLLHGGLPLHGAGMELDDHYFGVMVRSGTGKSTLIGALLQPGARFGNDDLIPVYFDGECALATPSVSLYRKLHKTALESMGVDWSTLTEAAGDHEEYWLPIERDRRVPAPGPLCALFFLEPGGMAGDGIAAVRLEAAEAAAQLPRHMHGVWASLSHVSHKTLEPLYRRLAAAVPVYTLHYRRSFEVLPRLVDAIHDVLNDPPAGRREFHPAIQTVKA